MHDDPYPPGAAPKTLHNKLQLLIDLNEAEHDGSWLPDEQQLTNWVLVALSESLPAAMQLQNIEVSLSCVSSDTIHALNKQYRNADKPTNVLSFPADMPLMPSDVDVDFNGNDDDESAMASTAILGDVVVCPEVLLKEAAEQGKPLENHWAHMVVHSVLHLNGLDHVDKSSADAMESCEIQILSQLGINNPYIAASAKHHE